jgi:hypothetical protein
MKQSIQVITRKFEDKLKTMNPNKITSIAVNYFNEENTSQLLPGFVTNGRVLAL